MDIIKFLEDKCRDITDEERQVFMRDAVLK